eukprot:COSAG05_NODE_324_length_11401_cov_6.009379_8_plen_39_part_00
MPGALEDGYPIGRARRRLPGVLRRRERLPRRRVHAPDA